MKKIIYSLCLLTCLIAPEKITASSPEQTSYAEDYAEDYAEEIGRSVFVDADKHSEPAETPSMQYLQELHKLAERGSSYHQSSLGQIYMEGKVAPQDYQQAIYWFERAARQGHKDSLTMLIKLYGRGDHVPKDEQKARYWHEQLASVLFYETQKAFDSGDLTAQTQLARMYIDGFGVEKDQERGIYLLRDAALNNSARAQFFLGIFYFDGYAVPENIEQAIHWTTKSAYQGYTNAQVQLGRIYFSLDKSNPQNLITAYAWLSVANEQYNDNIQPMLNTVSRGLSPTEIQDARTLAQQLKTEMVN